MHRILWVAVLFAACGETPTDANRMSPTHDVRPDLVHVTIESEEELMERRELLVEKVLSSVPKQHRLSVRRVLAPGSSTRIFAVDDSEEQASLIAEIYALDLAISRVRSMTEESSN